MENDRNISNISRLSVSPLSHSVDLWYLLVEYLCFDVFSYSVFGWFDVAALRGIALKIWSDVPKSHRNVCGYRSLLRDLWMLRLSWSRACWQLSLRIGGSLDRRIKSDLIPIHSRNSTKTNRMIWIDLRVLFFPVRTACDLDTIIACARPTEPFVLIFAANWSDLLVRLRCAIYFLVHFVRIAGRNRFSLPFFLSFSISILGAHRLECSWHSCKHDVSMDQRTSNGPTECR